MKSLTIAVAAFLAAWMPSGLADGSALTLQEAVHQSDLIAHVRILSTAPLPPEEGKSAGDLEKYRKEAFAKVLHPVKGCKKGDELQLTFDNGYGFPNVQYAMGQEYIVFLRRAGDSGRFSTMNLFSGRFWVEKGTVPNFYLMNSLRGDSPAPSVKKIVSWLTNASKAKAYAVK